MSVTSSILQKRPGRHASTIGIGFDIRGVGDFGRGMHELLDSRLPWIHQDAMKTVYRAIPVFARRDIQDEYNIRAGRVREHMAVRYIEGQGAARGGVRLFGQWKRGIGMMQFPGTRQTRKGVTYSVYRGQRTRADDAFIVRLKSGNVHAVEQDVTAGKTWQRKYVDRQGKRAGPVRQRTRMDYPLKVLYRSTVAQMLARGRRPERIAEHATRLMESETRRLLGRYLK